MAAETVERRVGVMLGWRCWSTTPTENVLRPIVMKGLVWKPREPHEALCPEQVHPVPSHGCKCGL